MGFLQRVEIAADSMAVPLDEVYAEDPQFKELVDLAIDILYKFSHKFHLNEKTVVDLFIKQIRKEI